MTTPNDMGRATDGAERQVAGPYFFVGEALALDLVNTEAVIRGRSRDLLDGPGGFAAWWGEAAARYPDLLGVSAERSALAERRSLDAARRLRSALRRIFEAVAGGTGIDRADLTTLNEALATGRETIELTDGGGLLAIRRSREAGVAAALLPIGVSARDLLADRDPARLHRCANERCVLLFYDTTKSATRRWCSTGCMDRARSAERYRLRRAPPWTPAIRPDAVTMACGDNGAMKPGGDRKREP